MINILITGVGAPGIKGTIYCLFNNPNKIPIKIIGIDMDPKAVGQFFVNYFYAVSSPTDPGYFEEIKQIIIKEKINLIIPQTSSETIFYSKNKSIFELMDVKVLVVSEHAACIASNKYLTLQNFLGENLPVTQHYLVNNLNEFEDALKKLDYPSKKIVVKKPVSNGMRGFRILSEENLSIEQFLMEKPQVDHVSLSVFINMLKSINADFPELLITEYLPGEEYSVDIFRSPHEICIVPRIRERIRSGISFLNKIDKHTEIIKISKKAAEIMELFGVFGFQFKLDNNGIAKILECNPRIQGSMVASYFAGVNIIWYGVADILGFDYVVQKPQWGKSFYRYWGGIGLHNDLQRYETI